MNVMKKNNLIVVIGAGAGAIGVAYALKDLNKQVLIIDEQPYIGGTHVNAWVNVHAATSAPPFLEKVVEDIKDKIVYLDAGYQNFKDTSKLNYKMSLLHEKFVNPKYIDHNWQEVSIEFNPKDMREKYMKDLTASGNISMKFNTRFKRIEKEFVDSSGRKYIQKIVVENLLTKTEEVIEAAAFLDCSGDSVLIRAVDGNELGTDYFLGIDRKNKFGNGTEPNNLNDTDIETALNCPTLMYGVDGTHEDKSLPEVKYTDNGLLYEDTYNNIYINTISYLWLEGIDALKSKEWTYNYMRDELPRHWNTIKNGGNERFANWELKTKGFVGVAPMLGVRETYRTFCERMLTESDLYIQISSANMAEGDNLDKKIAVGNHSVDIHYVTKDGPNSGVQNIDTRKINEALRPYGVPYGCIIPKGLSNVLVASRGAGLSHIAAASFRLNKDIMQLGWAAGKAVALYTDDKFKGGEKDFRFIDADLLQERMDFYKSVELLESIM